MDIARVTGKASALLILRKVWAGILNLFVISYLARILNKSDFGLFSISWSFILIIDNLGPSSIGDYLVYRKDDGNEDIVNSAFWLNCLLLLLVGTIILILGPYWAKYYNNITIKYLINILAIGLIGKIFEIIPTAILKRNLDYKPIIIIQTITGTLSQMSQLALAIIGLGVYSLAIPYAVFQLIVGIYLFIVVRPKIHLNIGAKYWKEIFVYIRYLIGSKLLTRISMDGDSLIVGKTLGLTMLGVYNISSNLSNLFNQNLMPILEDVSLPVFSKYNTQTLALRRQYLYITRLVSLFLTPIYFILIIFAPTIITSLYGTKWMDAILPLQILCVYSLIRSISYPTTVLYNALGKPKIEFYFTLIFTPIFLLLIWLFSFKGLVATCIVITVMKILSSTYHIIRSGNLISLSPGKFFKELKHVIIPNVLLGILYISVLQFIHNLNVKYLMILFYIPSIYFISYALYRKNILKDYLLVFKLFPGLNFIRVRLNA